MSGIQERLEVSISSSGDKYSKNDSDRLPLGELLIKERLITRQQLSEAMKLQEKERGKDKPLGEILLECGFITGQVLMGIINEFGMKMKLGEIMVKKGFITPAQMDIVIKRQERDRRYFGEVLVDLGFMKIEEFYNFMRKQVNIPRLGEILVNRGLISPSDLEKALKIQKKHRYLGDILVEQGYITRELLDYMLDKYERREKLGLILMREGYINKGQLEKIMSEEDRLGGFKKERLGTVLVERGIITNEQLTMALAMQHDLSFKKLNKHTFMADQLNQLRKLINKKYSFKYGLIPISCVGDELTVATADIENIKSALADLKKVMPRFRIKCCLILKENFVGLQDMLYSENGNKADQDYSSKIEFISDVESDKLSRKGKTKYVSGEDIGDEDVVRLVVQIIREGILHNASDIHIENDLTGANVRYRIDGILQPLLEPALTDRIKHKINPIVSRIKILANLDIAERRLPQDGSFKMNYLDKEKGETSLFDFRVATIKGGAGSEDVTIRILDSRKVAAFGLAKLSLSPSIEVVFKELLTSPAGLILITGPTGSGKTTTLYSSLKYIYNPGIKIVTVEDPIEYTFPGIAQTQINPRIDLTFAKVLRSFLRHDPNVILVGEIRDSETADTAIKAAQTGHLILSTLHTNDSTGVITRLRDLGIDNDQISSSLLGIMAQRLVRLNCPGCSRNYIPASEEWSHLFHRSPIEVRFRQGEGCNICSHTGYKGRATIAELFVPDRDTTPLIKSGAPLSEIRAAAMKNGMKSMVEDAVDKIGSTTLQELLRVLPHHLIDEFKHKGQSKREIKTPQATLEEDILGDRKEGMLNLNYETDMVERVSALQSEHKIPPAISKEVIINEGRDVKKASAMTEPDKKDWERHYQLGLSFMEKGDYNSAIQEFRTASMDSSLAAKCEGMMELCCEKKMMKGL